MYIRKKKFASVLSKFTIIPFPFEIICCGEFFVKSKNNQETFNLRILKLILQLNFIFFYNDW